VAIDENLITELLRTKGTTLYHREGQEVEFKEQFNFGGLAEYFRDFAAFANNRGGYLIFGIKDSPRIPNGISAPSLDQFNKIDEGVLTGYLLEIYSADIRWERAIIEIESKPFGVFRIYEAQNKPVIARKDESKGTDQIIKNGEIYYRYGGRTQKIQYAELENIINKRIQQNNSQWLDLMAKIGKAGPQNAAILDTEKSLIEKDDSRILVLDEGLAKKLKYIKEGQFSEKSGAATLKLIGDVVPMSKVEVVKKVKESILSAYPLSAKELSTEIRKRAPEIPQHEIWQAIKENDVKNNPDYSTYNFRNKQQEDKYRATGELPAGIPSIYNNKAVDFLVTVLKSKK
jgi:hypothetical protein